MTFAPGGECPATAPAGPSSLMRSPSIRIAWLVRTAPARASTRRPALTRTVWGAGGAVGAWAGSRTVRSEEHTSELQSLAYLVCRLLLEKKNSHTRLLCVAALLIIAARLPPPVHIRL